MFEGPQPVPTQPGVALLGANDGSHFPLVLFDYRFVDLRYVGPLAVVFFFKRQDFDRS